MKSIEKFKKYGDFYLYVSDYKENGFFQFNLATKLPFINTNKDFATTEEAFDYADQLIKKEFSDIVFNLEKNKTIY